MSNKLIIIKEQILNASPAEVWEIITKPIFFSQWMFVPGKAIDVNDFGLGSKIEWTDDKGVVYLTGEVITFIPNQKLVIGMQDISWKIKVPIDAVTYEYHLSENQNSTMVKFYLGDLSVDPEGQLWFDAYNSSNEIQSIEKLIQLKREVE